MTEPVDLKLAVGPRAAFGDELLATVAAEYGIGPVREVLDLGGTYNLNLLLRTSDAAYVTRVYHPWMTPSRLAFVQAAKRDLARAGFPAVEVVPSRRGDGMVQVGDRWLEVEPFVAHDGVADSWEKDAEAFAELGRLHSLLAEILPGEPFVAPVVGNYAAPDVLTRWIEQTRIAVGAHAPSAAAIHADGVCRDALACLAEIRGWWDGAREDLPVQPIHGDFGGGNVLFAGSRVVAVLDFDFLAQRERIFDLAYTLFWVVRNLGGEEHEGLPWRRVASLLARYDAATPRPLTQAELRALPIEMARVPLYWIGEAHFKVDPVPSVVEWEADVIRAAWLLRHHEAIVADLLGERNR